MPIHVRYQDVTDVTIRPTPLVNISSQVLKTAAGKSFGITYNITLTGTLLADQGSPYARDTQTDSIFDFYGATIPALAGPYNAFDTNISHVDGSKPPKQKIPLDKAATAIITKQRALRALFARDGQRVEITDYQEDRAAIVFYPRLLDISFSEGIWVDRCDFSITFEADTLLYGEGEVAGLVDEDGSIISDGLVKSGLLEEDIIDDLSSVQGFISTYTDDWDLQIDQSFGTDTSNPFSYVITHTVTANGRQHWGPNGEQEAWKEARRFVRGRLAQNGIYDYPNIDFPVGWDGTQPVTFAPETIGLTAFFTGYNYKINETINETDGSYSITESWNVSPSDTQEPDQEDKSDETYNTTTTISNGDPYVSVSVDGSIRGLSEDTVNGVVGDPDNDFSALENAMSRWHFLTNNAQFGVGCLLYKRLNSLVAVELNSQPLTLTVSQDVFTGEISYNAEFNNRPTNFITGTVSESISVSDNYPGDVYASIPVIGRETGPVLQYIGGRTEYSRDLSISFVVDYTRVPYASGRNPFVLTKPSIIEPTASEIAAVINANSPANEPGIRKYFVNPPSESWDAKTGSYSFNISWVYEVDK